VFFVLFCGNKSGSKSETLQDSGAQNAAEIISCKRLIFLAVAVISNALWTRQK
jgi:hypothetical protein